MQEFWTALAAVSSAGVLLGGLFVWIVKSVIANQLAPLVTRIAVIETRLQEVEARHRSHRLST